MLFFYATVDFYLFNDGTADMQILALLKSQCRVSDTQVTVKACEPLVFVDGIYFAHVLRK